MVWTFPLKMAMEYRRKWAREHGLTLSQMYDQFPWENGDPLPEETKRRSSTKIKIEKTETCEQTAERLTKEM